MVESRDGILPVLAEADAVTTEADSPGTFDWCEDCLGEGAELVLEAPLSGIDAPFLPGSERTQ